MGIAPSNHRVISTTNKPPRHPHTCLILIDSDSTGETAELLWQELSDDEGTYQAHDIVFDKQSSKGSLPPVNRVIPRDLEIDL